MENFDWWENEEHYSANVLADVVETDQADTVYLFLFRI